jgi:hypothetical protein
MNGAGRPDAGKNGLHFGIGNWEFGTGNYKNPQFLIPNS